MLFHDYSPRHEGVGIAVIGELARGREGLGEALARLQQGRRPLAPISRARVHVLIAVEPGDSLAGPHPHLGRPEGKPLNHHDGRAGNASLSSMLHWPVAAVVASCSEKQPARMTSPKTPVARQHRLRNAVLAGRHFTTTTPLINGCGVQWYAYVPGREKVMLASHPSRSRPY